MGFPWVSHIKNIVPPFSGHQFAMGSRLANPALAQLVIYPAPVVPSDLCHGQNMASVVWQWEAF
jgi:hypothetical protein